MNYIIGVLLGFLGGGLFGFAIAIIGQCRLEERYAEQKYAKINGEIYRLIKLDDTIGE